MQPGETARIGVYDVELAGVSEVEGPNYSALRAVFKTTRDGSPVADIASERRFFPAEAQSTTEAGLHTNLWRDLYFVLGDQTPEGAWAVRLYINPFVIWIWGGVGIMALGGLISLFDRRLRIGAPTTATAHRPTAAGAAPEPDAPEAGARA
jgi:cytochrome c-type biogenesis protein CcmF